MSARRKLCASALASLQRQHRHPHPLPQNPHRSSLPPRDSTRSSLLPRNPPIPLNRRHGLLLEWHSYSTAADGGGGAALVCWNCGAAAAAAAAAGASPGPFLSCSSCGSVQPMDPSVDYFQIFGLERRYDIPDDNLGGKYKVWQKKLHPDLVQLKSEKEKAFAAEQSGRVIDAYRTLSKPLSRAVYLLQLEDIDVDEENTVTEPELLTEMMEIREAVDEANDSQALKQIGLEIEKKFETSATSFREAFEKKDFGSAITWIQKMRYYDRAIEAIEKKMPDE